MKDYGRNECSLICNETILGAFGFVRISANKIVNMYHVKKLNSKKREIHMSNKCILEVSRRKWLKIAEFFKLWITSYTIIMTTYTIILSTYKLRWPLCIKQQLYSYIC